MQVQLSVDQTNLAGLKSCLPISTNRNSVQHSRLFTTVLVWFVVLNAIQLYDLCTIKPKGGFLIEPGMKFSLQRTRYLQSFIKFLQKVCFAFRKQDHKNTRAQYLSKENCGPFLMCLFLILKLDPQNFFLTFLTLKLLIYEYQKLIQIAVLKSQVTVSTLRN